MEEKQKDPELLPRRKSQAQEPQSTRRMDIKKVSYVLTGMYKSQSMLPE